MERNKENLNKLLIKVKQIPNTPGVYKFYSAGNLVYVGKSKSLRSRVLSYFRKIQEREKINVMMRNVDDVQVEFNDTHLEARLLEFNLIRNNMPIYNAQFKIKKTEYYLGITDKLLDINTISGVGPFIGQRFLREFKRNLEYLFPIEICNGEINFQYNIITKRLNQEEIKNTKTALERIFLDIEYLDKLIEKCIEEMRNHSINLQFERAAFFKNLINELGYIREIIIDKNDFLNGQYIFRENGFLQLIDRGNLVFKCPDNGIDELIKAIKEIKYNDDSSFEIKSIVYSHSKEKDLEVIKLE